VLYFLLLLVLLAMKNIIMTILITLLLWLIIGGMVIVTAVDAFGICEATVGQIPDIYGQFHPAETPELLERKLEEFVYEVDKIPPDQRKYAIDRIIFLCQKVPSNAYKFIWVVKKKH
jgi:hypothetical protein